MTFTLDTIKIAPEHPLFAKSIQEQWNSFDPEHSLGDLEKMTIAYGSMTGMIPLELKTAMVLMCGDHGIAQYGVSAYPPEVTIQMIGGYVQGRAGANVLARHANTDIFITDVGVNADLSSWPLVRNFKVAYGTSDFTQGPAMSREQALQGIAAGIKMADEAIDKGYNLLATAEMGIGNTTSTAAITSAILHLTPEETVGRGTGINDARMLIKKKVVADGLACNQPQGEDGLDVLSKVGGYDHAGLAGLIIGGACRGVPTMVDGVNATAAALIAFKLFPETAKFMFCSHLSAEIAHRKMLQVMQLEPIVDAGMRLGEGTGASLAIVILNNALQIFNKAR